MGRRDEGGGPVSAVVPLPDRSTPGPLCRPEGWRGPDTADDVILDDRDADDVAQTTCLDCLRLELDHARDELSEWEAEDDARRERGAGAQDAVERVLHDACLVLVDVRRYVDDLAREHLLDPDNPHETRVRGLERDVRAVVDGLDETLQGMRS